MTTLSELAQLSVFLLILLFSTLVLDGEFLGVKATGKKIKTSVMNFYYFNKDGKITNDIAAEGMIGILRPLGLSK